MDRLLEVQRLPGGRWLDIGAGDGALIRHVSAWRPTASDQPPRPAHIRWTALEKRPRCRRALEELGAETLIGSLDEWEAELARRPRFDVVFMNPPFGLILPFLLCALRCARLVVCLQRSTFLGDERARRARFKDDMPWREYRIGRLDFDGRGGDSTTYSWFIFRTEYPACDYTETRLLDQTHAALREHPRKR